MRLTRSQRELVEAGAREIREPVETEVVKVVAPYSGVTTAIREAIRLARADRRRPAAAHLIATSQWDAEISLMKHTTRQSWINSHVQAWDIGLTHLAAQGARGVVVWLDGAGRMTARDQEVTQAIAEWVARHREIPLRMVWCINRISAWCNAKQARAHVWRVAEALLQRGRLWEFTREGLDEAMEERGAAEAGRKAAVGA
ncbi:MAG: hypothetical protein N3A38_12145 [Planctomycetota bacterium]|nr:hypothetical protein [Planctomycetota bacterium]